MLKYYCSWVIGMTFVFMAGTLSQMPCVLPAGSDFRHTSRDGQRIIFAFFFIHWIVSALPLEGSTIEKCLIDGNATSSPQNREQKTYIMEFLHQTPPLVLVFHSTLMVFLLGRFEKGFFIVDI